MGFKDIIKVLIFFVGFSAFAQEKSFYIRSIRSIHLENTPSVMQQLKFEPVDVVYNKITQFLNDKITISSSGTFEVSAFANINPGVMGSSSKDSIHMELYLIKNPQSPNEEILGKTEFRFSFGNFDVAAGLLIPPTEVQLQKNDEISLWVKILPTSNIDINKSPKYDHVTKPTGMQQIAGMRIEKLL